jgi:hypothetical protein
MTERIGATHLWRHRSRGYKKQEFSYAFFILLNYGHAIQREIASGKTTKSTYFARNRKRDVQRAQKNINAAIKIGSDTRERSDGAGSTIGFISRPQNRFAHLEISYALTTIPIVQRQCLCTILGQSRELNDQGLGNRRRKEQRGGRPHHNK